MGKKMTTRVGRGAFKATSANARKAPAASPAIPITRRLRRSRGPMLMAADSNAFSFPLGTTGAERCQRLPRVDALADASIDDAHSPGGRCLRRDELLARALRRSGCARLIRAGLTRGEQS